MGRYRFRKGGTSRKTLMEKCISLITIRGKQRGSIRETGMPFYTYIHICCAFEHVLNGILFKAACAPYARRSLFENNNKRPQRNAVLCRDKRYARLPTWVSGNAKYF